MEMDAASHNRFAFSLCHNTTVPFEAFSPAPDQHYGGAGGDPAMLPTAERPKLEDFLGGCGGESSSGETAAAETGASCGGYDPHIRRIAAGFVQGFAAEHLDSATLAAVETAKPRGLAEPFGQRTSIYRGVTKHRWTGRYEAHLWDNGCLRDGQRRKGRQVYLGGYDREEKAARAYDLAALKYWGSNTTTNFPVSNYEEELKEMNNVTRQEFVASLRRKSSGFSRGASMYRGVTRHHHHGRWQARIGRVAGNKDLYLGTFSTQEEAAEAYDIAAIKFRGLNAVTNFNMSRYDVERILNSNLPIGSVSGKTLKTSEYSSSAPFTSNAWHQISGKDSSAMTSKQEEEDYWSSSLALHPQQQQQQRHDQQQRNQTTLGFEVFGSGVSTMDFSTAAASVGGVGRGRVGTVVWDDRMAQLQQEQSLSGCSSVPHRAAPNIAMWGTNRVLGGAYCGSLTCNPFLGWINGANGLSE